MNVFPSTMGTDIASSTTDFIMQSGILPYVELIGGIVVGFFILEIVISLLSKRHSATAGAQAPHDITPTA